MRKKYAILTLAFFGLAAGQKVSAQAIETEQFRARFEAARKDAEVVATVRVLSVACNELAVNDDRHKKARLQLSLLVLEKHKGNVKPGDIVVVGHIVPLPTDSGPKLQPYLTATREFPITPGARGEVALRWNQDARQYAVVGGWVPEPNNSTIPRELGQVFTWNDTNSLRVGMLREEVIKRLGPPQKVDNSQPNGGVILTFDGLELTFRNDRLEGALLRLQK